MAIPWRRRRPVPVHEPMQSVPDLVHDLKQLTARLSSEVDRLEHVNDAAQRANQEGSR